MEGKEYVAYLEAKHRSTLFAVARKLSGHRSTPEDLCQEVWCKVLVCSEDKRPDVQGELPWLMALLRNRSIDLGRKKSDKFLALTGDSVGNIAASTSNMAELMELTVKEEIEEFLDCMRTLPEPFYAAMKHRYVEFLPVVETATRMQVSVGQISKYCKEAYAKLRDCMTRKGFE